MRKYNEKVVKIHRFFKTCYVLVSHDYEGPITNQYGYRTKQEALDHLTKIKPDNKE